MSTPEEKIITGIPKMYNFSDIKSLNAFCLRQRCIQWFGANLKKFYTEINVCVFVKSYLNGV